MILPVSEGIVQKTAAFLDKSWTNPFVFFAPVRTYVPLHKNYKVMADINQTDVEFNVNNEKAKTRLDEIKKKLNELEIAWAKVAATGDKETRDKLNKRIQETKRELRQMESGTKACERVFQQLNKATPTDLNKALKHLQSELKTIERGTPAWDAHVEKIRRVKAELDKINAEMRQSESLLVRMKNKLNDWGTMIAGGAAALTGVVMAGKKAVQTYAEMQQEEANVRKYTGMTEEQVNHLNDAFKKMDTRSGREQLNQLAQEAGRLGLQSEEDVLGFVRAADKINVALDDLGDGATLTLSKLTDIFGDKERLGVEQSLLAVGSVINELSQNSTAAAPYLAEFGQRLAGVGAQAHMTIPEIMGFGAVLDSQGQKLEMSATALSKVIMNLFKDPAKIAQATGLAVEEFSETCKRSTNEGLLMLLDRLHELGGIDTLAPVFKDMGENGARASAVLAALAGNVDQVRAQQEAANTAFLEAVSIDKEFNVQNETVQAGLEKAKKRFNEMAVELGQKLLPVMKMFHSSMSYTMKALSVTIDFIIKYRKEIAVVASGIAAYTLVVNAARIADIAWTTAKKIATAAQLAFNAALRSNPLGLLIGIAASAATALYNYTKGLKSATKETKELTDAQKRQIKIQEDLKSHEQNIENAYAAEAGKVRALTKVVNDNTVSLDKRRAALEELKKIVPDYHAMLTDEGTLIKNNTQALDDYYTSLKKRIRMEVSKEKLEGIASEQVNKEELIESENKKMAELAAQREELYRKMDEMVIPAINAGDDAKLEKIRSSAAYKQIEKELDNISFELGIAGKKVTQYRQDVKDLEKEADSILKEIEEGTTLPPTPEPQPSPKPTGENDADKKHKEELAVIEDWKKKEQAIIELAYAKGEDTYSVYKKRMLDMEEEYHKKRLEKMTKGTTEYWEEQNRYEKQKRADSNAKSLKEQENFYADEKRCLNEQYMNSELNYEQYTRALEDAELDHLYNVIGIYNKGSKEYLDAEEKFRAREHEIQKKRFNERKKIEDNIKKLYFTKGNQHTSDKEEYEKQSAALEVVRNQLKAQANTNEERLAIEKAYQEAKYLLAKEYNQKEVMETMNAWRAAGDEIQKFLESDLGKNMAKGYGGLVGQLSSLFSALTDTIDAESEAQKKIIEDQYEKDLKAAGNNEAKKVALEKQHKADIAKIESEAAEKKFNMQVIETVATGIQSAVSAWSAGWQTGAAGVVLAPLFMAMSLATTGIQIAALKKQRDLAVSQGYASGGYTKPGRKDEPAGIVHAGEWVASQELLANPTAAATIAQLDQAQRTNTIGTLDRRQVSASVSAPVAAVRVTEHSTESNTELSDTLKKLNDRLNRPFVTQNVVTGDKGLLRAQKDYERLMKNKS